MRSFYYRPGKNAGLAVMLGAIGFVFGSIAWNAGGGVIIWTLTVMLLAGAAKAALNALNGDPALKFDDHHIWVRTTFGGLQEVSWRDVQHIALEVMVMRYFGMIPVGRNEILCITTSGGPFGTRRFRLAAGTLELPPGGATGLMHLLHQAQTEANAGPRAGGAAGLVPGASAVAEPVAESSSGFDPDAAVARYLAAKQAQQAEQAEQRDAPAGLGPRPIAPRPVFGRRAS